MENNDGNFVIVSVSFSVNIINSSTEEVRNEMDMLRNAVIRVGEANIDSMHKRYDITSFSIGSNVNFLPMGDDDDCVEL